MKILIYYDISSRGTKKSQFRSYRQRNAKNAPKTKKSLKMALSRKKPVCALPDEEKPVSLVSSKKSQFAPSPDEKLQQKRHFARKHTNKKDLRDYPWHRLHLNLCGWVLWKDFIIVNIRAYLNRKI